MFNSKKGNFPDIPEYLEAVLVIVFSLVIGFLIFSNFNSNVQANSNIPAISKTASSAFQTSFFFQSDFIIPFLTLGFFGFSIVASRLIPSSSKFIWISILAMLFMPLIAMFFGNIWDGFRTQSMISTALQNFPWSSFFLDNIVIVSAVYSFCVAVALLTKDEVAPQ